MKFLRFACAMALMGSLTLACKKNSDEPNAAQDDVVSMNAYDSTYIHPLKNDAVSKSAKLSGFQYGSIYSAKLNDVSTINSGNGQMVAINDSTVFYKPRPGFLGTETYKYYVDDNGKNVAGNITIVVGNKAQRYTDSLIFANVDKALFLFAIDSDTSYGYNTYNTNYSGDLFYVLGQKNKLTLLINAPKLIEVGLTNKYSLLSTGVVQMIAEDGKKVFFEIVGPYQTIGHRHDGSTVTLSGLHLRVGAKNLYYTNGLK